MGPVLDDRIPDVLARTELSALVGEYAGPAARQQGGTETFHCPHPDHPDRTPSFTVSDGRWRCWSVCDRAGDAVDLVVWLDGLTKAEAIERLAARVGLARDTHPVRSAARPAPALDGVLDRFLDGRGWDREVTDRLGVHAVAHRGEARIRFPFRWNGADVYHQDRAVGGSGPKWLSATGTIPCPYNADAMRLARRRRAVFVVEGVSDVVALHHSFEEPAVIGAPGAGAFKRDWATVQLFGGLTVVVVGDNDLAGLRFRTKVIDLLVPVARVVVNLHVPKRHKDLDAWRAENPDRFATALLAAAGEVGGRLAA